MKKLIIFPLVLGIICGVAGLVLAFVNSKTEKRIDAQKRKIEAKARGDVFTGEHTFEEKIRAQDKGKYTEVRTSDGVLSGYIFVTRQQGYSSVIKVMTGITVKGAISHIKVLSQKETPGLGTRIEEKKPTTTWVGKLRGETPAPEEPPVFQAQFDNKKQEELDSVDAITGATITSIAVKKAVETAFSIYLEIRSQNNKVVNNRR